MGKKEGGKGAETKGERNGRMQGETVERREASDRDLYGIVPARAEEQVVILVAEREGEDSVRVPDLKGRDKFRMNGRDEIRFGLNVREQIRFKCPTF